ncbi:GntP family transporter [Rathayibacter rathayi]|uniref:GntP family transporter n=1 Tax=Rathayibacter rathayi TaxID=33887 RepID=A0ABD6W5I6_RATRA|nr:GntP family transporter [Rathayibacter rathayi]AZZ47795.1 GntP family transporter [Rathayibacter rathayi]MWV75046.1 GntP family transporter [Rathayibacter rathayi NCPPB 2980 = VKM Ac-1601]PPF10273.1 GntP family transporter [Rathayibacter rathayi]PPF44311.1 GntP family transporter [Rathayibacter rathayi]PPF75428.1 GntP family transporter [Rathayibacter rathayi]
MTLLTAVRSAADTPIAPATTLGTPLLLGIAAAGITLLLVLIIRFKIHAFVALLLVSVLVALSAQIPPADVFTLVANGVGSTMGKVALIIALGAILGRLIEVSGGVQSLADHFTRALGPRRVAVALTIVAFLVAIPVFFEVGVIVLVPIIYAFSKVAGLNPVRFGLPMVGLMLAVHVAVPPHPGIVAGAGVFGADIGLIALIALPICAVLGVLSSAVAALMNRREYELAPAVAAQLAENNGVTEAVRTVGRDGTVLASPRAGLIILLVAIPVVQILAGTVGALLLPEGGTAHGISVFIGTPVLALLVAVGIAYFALPVKRGWSLTQTNEIFESALPPVASILLVVAGGGVFGAVLQASGIGGALATTLDTLGVPLIVLGFVVSLLLRAAQGSATVAIVTTGGLLATGVADGGYTPLQIAIITVAVGFGSLGLSHVTDAGFWVVTRYLGLSVADGLRTWTVLTTVLGLAGFSLTCVVWVFVGAIA